jgi:hypothetical protein
MFLPPQPGANTLEAAAGWRAVKNLLSLAVMFNCAERLKNPRQPSSRQGGNTPLTKH